MSPRHTCAGELSVAAGVECSARPTFGIRTQLAEAPGVTCYACAHHLAQVCRRVARTSPDSPVGSPVTVWGVTDGIGR